MMMADNGNDSGQWPALFMGVEVLMLSTIFFLMVRQSHQASRIVMVPVLLLVGIVRVHYLFDDSVEGLEIGLVRIAKFNC
jgi:hypothetical protein